MAKTKKRRERMEENKKDDGMIIQLAQLFMSKGMMSDDECIAFMKEGRDNVVDGASVIDMVNQLNARFHPFRLHVLRITAEFNQFKWYSVLTNQIAEGAVGATPFDESQILFFQAIVCIFNFV